MIKKIYFFIFLFVVFVYGCSDIMDNKHDNSISSGSENSENTNQNGNSGNSNGGSGNGNTEQGSGNSGNSGTETPEKEPKLDILYEINNLTVKFSIDYNNVYGEIKSCFWDFTEGYSDDINPEYTFKSEGKHVVILDITFENGKKEQIRKEIELISSDIKHVFLQGFGENPDYMYFALRIKGHSTNHLYKQEITSSIFGGQGTAYVRDLEVIMQNNEGKKYPFSAAYKNLGLSHIYSEEYGFSDKDGSNFNMNFYLGDNIFKIPLNTSRVVFNSFVIVDMTKKGFGGEFSNPVFVRCNIGNMHFDIPYTEYNKNIHRNIALLTIEFDGSIQKCGDYGAYTVTFDGFVEK